MRSVNLLRFLALHGIAIGLGASVATSCIGVNYPTVAFRCNPRQADNCPDTHFCCSDDPAAEGGALPAYDGKGINGGQAFFSGSNNALGTSGLCVNRDDIPFGSGLQEPAAANCPIPCNPLWAGSDIAAVCGDGRVCCQTEQLDPKDCVIDPADGTYRPVTGADIGQRYDNGTVITSWSAGDHVTHQDPSGFGCKGLAGNPPDAELNTNPIWQDCVANLTVANQRGFCMALAAGQMCPVQQVGYVDACTQLNQGGAAVPPA
jgi:hypothetical protein